MSKLDYYKKKLQQARKKEKKKRAEQKHAKQRAKHFIRIYKRNLENEARRARAKRKVAYWREVKLAARRRAEYWDIKRKYWLHKKIQWLKDHPSKVQGFSQPDKVWNPYNRRVCGWMIQWLDKARVHGWSGVVVSGVRTPEESEGLCYGMCDQPTCSGRCAGRGSNHNATTCDFPQGAIDVTDYFNFAAIMREIGAPLRNDLPLDRVHFSYTGH